MEMVKDKNKSYIFNKGRMVIYLVLGGLLFSSCSIEKRLSTKLNRDFKQSEILKDHHVGFVLYDPVKGVPVFEENGDQYFIPASNTKLFTFYAALKMLGDSIPSLRYIERNDSLIFWGTGDPSFLQSRLKQGNAWQFLKTTNRKLFLASGRHQEPFYGKGWSWDDYNDYYQAEINEFPMMDNLVSVRAKQGKLQILPKSFQACFVVDSGRTQKPFNVLRKSGENSFHYPQGSIPEGFSQEIPYKLSLSTTLTLLSDTLHKPVGLVEMKMPENARTIYNVPKDPLLKAMLQPSDNFIAEQLLLVCSDQLGEELSTEKTIQYVLKTYLSDLPDSAVWVDGSGLSRMNLFTPRDMVVVLDLIYKNVNDRGRLFDLLPAGGKSGTLKNAYPKTDTPFVFGKTGTLSNVHNQSGYILTKKGKLYIYSFMNNNFVAPVSKIRNEIGRIIMGVHEKF
ncbi:D-alanyl-D-alanine carboxypeptidase/D-alanyl-D-alanine-endopeptidase [Pedobacter caeni]|uniref:D-alanyl-D-alanine carboxypeptidase / D-alanyl-D-alanine-endopeptidase (Penicillin-binding protein 4) n=1 Tax=Pedobacter caeni TaxID=288992 RepID=A0A1M5MH94_9SPHI|nr:D-alanyl-D-alanine carboxypeptidase [Pedobacter caeni]SHG76309.1 D-alanyl-D-alanine carboxypeptidase / D-alanyl-D-alanine-endopeptidase (penicillin-binding protein 4) [Pedobacter caeni]